MGGRSSVPATTAAPASGGRGSKSDLAGSTARTGINIIHEPSSEFETQFRVRVEGTFYGSAFGTNAKSFVWYGLPALAAAGYEVPTTWGEMILLSDQMSLRVIAGLVFGSGSRRVRSSR